MSFLILQTSILIIEDYIRKLLQKRIGAVMLMPVMFAFALSHLLESMLLHHNSSFHIPLMISALNISPEH